MTQCVVTDRIASTRSNGIRCHDPEELKGLSLITAIKTPYLKNGARCAPKLAET